MKSNLMGQKEFSNLRNYFEINWLIKMKISNLRDQYKTTQNLKIKSVIQFNSNNNDGDERNNQINVNYY